MEKKPLNQKQAQSVVNKNRFKLWLITLQALQGV